jgi:hypothetical protein
MINLENKEKACRELMLLLDVLPDQYTEKIPAALLETIRSRQDLTYHPDWEGTLTMDSDGRSLNLLHETLVLVAALNLEYWEEDEAVKRRLLRVYRHNDRKKGE